MENKIYFVYLFRVKESQKIIYVGSTARPITRFKEHLEALEGKRKNNQKIYDYMNRNNYKLYSDVEIVLCERVKSREEMYKKEAEYYFKYKDTILNDRPAENINGDYNPKRKKVKCLNDGNIFQSISSCAKYYKKGRTTITRALNNYKDNRGINVNYTYVDGEKYYFEYVYETCND